jgi:hypothetical protein
MKVVLTGGPSGGKTAIITLAQKEFFHHIAVVPEAASILFRGGFPRAVETSHMIHQQRAIYFLQIELEAIIAEQNPDKLIICDRGTIDGAAYWPTESKRTFFESVDTTLEKELKRYDCVIHLESADKNDYDRTNPYRTEGHSQAKVLDKRIKDIWSEHPRRFIVPNSKSFDQKIAEFFAILAQLK